MALIQLLKGIIKHLGSLSITFWSPRKGEPGICNVLQVVFLKKLGVSPPSVMVAQAAAACVVFLFSTNANPRDTAESNPAVRNTMSYDWADGYDPWAPTLSWSAIYTPASAGPIAMPTNSNSAPTPTDMPVNSFGEADTTMFQIAVIVSERPVAIMAKFTETVDPVAWYINNPNVP